MHTSLRRIGNSLASLLKMPSWTSFARWSDAAGKSAAEVRLQDKLRERLPSLSSVDVTDISHGCGDMYEVNVICPDFKGKPLVQQHRIVQNALKEDLKNWHGLRITTSSE